MAQRTGHLVVYHQNIVNVNEIQLLQRLVEDCPDAFWQFAKTRREYISHEYPEPISVYSSPRRWVCPLLIKLMGKENYVRVR